MRWNRYLIVALLISGAVLVTGFNVILEKTNTLEFCISCHSMASTVYPEYQQSTHYQNRTGIRAECPDCHVPKPFIPKIISKLKASKAWADKNHFLNTTGKTQIARQIITPNSAILFKVNIIISKANQRYEYSFLIKKEIAKAPKTNDSAPSNNVDEPDMEKTPISFVGTVNKKKTM